MPLHLPQLTRGLHRPLHPCVCVTKETSIDLAMILGDLSLSMIVVILTPPTMDCYLSVHNSPPSQQ